MKHNNTIRLEGLSKVFASTTQFLRQNTGKLNPGTVKRHKPVSQASEKVYIDRGDLHIEHMAELPLNRCVKTNLPTHKVLKVELRHPFQPLTWWGKRPRKLTVGLSKFSMQQHWVRKYFAWTMVALAALIALFGVWSNPWLWFVSVGLFIAGSMLQAISPVWARVAERKVTIVCGVCPAFGRQFDQYENGEPLN